MRIEEQAYSNEAEFLLGDRKFLDLPVRPREPSSLGVLSKEPGKTLTAKNFSHQVMTESLLTLTTTTSSYKFTFYRILPIHLGWIIMETLSANV